MIKTVYDVLSRTHSSEPANDQRGVGLKFDAGKTRMSLLPFDALRAIADVLTFGAQKYKAHSWRTIPNALERYKDAALRHWVALESGEWLDPESKLPHVGHLGCDVLFIVALALSQGAWAAPEKE
jgi:hypothetical protein